MKHYHAYVPVATAQGCRICGEALGAHSEPDLRSYDTMTIDGRNNILFRIFADAGIAPPTEDAAKWDNAMAWLDRSLVEAREYQRRLDQASLEGEYVANAQAIHRRFPGAKQGMEAVRRTGW
jgi:uncharacterized protein (DUF983 family)